MKFVQNYSALIGRLLISAMFLLAGLSKITGYEGTQAYMQAMGVSGKLLPLVIATELIGAAVIIIGFQTRVSAFVLAGFTLLSAVFFHFNFADQTQSILFMKNMAIAGGFLFLVANGAGNVSVDNFIAKKLSVI